MVERFYIESEGTETRPQKILEAEDRLEIIKNLRIASGKENDKLFEKHALLYREAHPSSHGVTLGIEIEIPESTILPPDDEWLLMKPKEKKKYLLEKKKEFEEARNAGVPSDEDLFWEFANLPANNPTTLAREVEALIALGLIKKDYAKFPLHVTVGGITFDKEQKEEDNHTHALARILDATAWETSGERLLSPYEGHDTDWTLHGADSGILVRKPEDGVSGEGADTKPAVEFRTSEFRNLSGLDRYLSSIYYLGSALRAYQEGKKDDPVVKQLAKIWRTLSGKCEILFEEMGLESPYHLWTLNAENEREPTAFRGLADILTKAESDENGREAKFVHDIRALIIEARAEIKEIIEADRK